MKTLRDITLKSGIVIAKDTEVTIKWLAPEVSRGVLCEVVTKDGQTFKTMVGTLHTKVSGCKKPPTLNTLRKWVFDGVAKSVLGKTVEPDGYDEHGSPSWLLALGFI